MVLATRRTHPPWVAKRAGVKMQHLNLNGVLYITGLVTLCEGFLGIHPHTNLF
jgi:hypothetical protein